LETLGPNLKSGIVTDAGDIAARPSEVRNEPRSNRIGGNANDGYRGRHRYEIEDHAGRYREDYIRVGANDIADQLRIVFGSTLRGKPFDDQVLTLDIAKPTEFFEECPVVSKA
jgi:hypothetical protein